MRISDWSSDVCSSDLDQLDQQRKRSELAEKRTAEAIHGRERLQHARRAAEGLVASRVADRPLTEAIAQFLDGQWRHYLTQTWLRDGADRSEERRVGKECVSSVDLGGRRIIKKKKTA